MNSKTKNLTIYENILLNDSLIKSIKKSKKIISRKINKNLLFEWNKTKWFIKKNKAILKKRNQKLLPPSLDAISFYIKQEKLWPENIKLPWVYLIAQVLGLKPERGKCWAILCPGKIDINVYQPDLKIISGKYLDEKRKKILQSIFLKHQGEIYFPIKESEFFFVKLPNQFSYMESAFPEKTISLYSTRFQNTNKINNIWRNILNNVEMEWHAINEVEKNEINSIWGWGWGSMPNELDCNIKSISKDETTFSNSKVASLAISALTSWIEKRGKKKLSLKIYQSKISINMFAIFDQISSSSQIEYKKNSEIEKSCIALTKHLNVFNKKIEENIDEDVYIANEEYILLKNKNFKMTIYDKIIFNFNMYSFFLLHILLKK